MGPEENSVLYQKIGVTISNIALSLLSKKTGDRIDSVTEYQQACGVSRGTIQNAFQHLKKIGAVVLVSRGHLGTFIEGMDYEKLQESCLIKEMIGIMPLPYSRTYEGLATAIYDQLGSFRFNMAYIRGAVGRIRLVENGTCQFALCSRYAAEDSIRKGSKIEIILDLGPGSFLSRHILLLRDREASGITDGMRVAYDEQSVDQQEITKRLVQGKKVTLVDLHIRQTLGALADGRIDAGVWNQDDLEENSHLKRFRNVEIPEGSYDQRFTTAVLVMRQNDPYLKELLTKNISREYTLTILEEVRQRKRETSF